MSIVHIAFYPSDWLAGTRGLSDAETGVYITLVARMYEMAAPIERDDNRLSRLCGCKTTSSFVKSLEYLISEGKIIMGPDGLFNERVEKEIKNATAKSDKAKAAAQSRWNRKPNKTNNPTHANASVEHILQPCQPEPEPEPEPDKKDTDVSLSKANPDEAISAISAFNEIAEKVGWPLVQKVTPARKSAVRARLRDVGGIEGWRAAIERASRSPLLVGQNNRGWRADFDWLCKPANFTKLIEGNYDDRSKPNQANARDSALHDEILAAARAR